MRSFLLFSFVTTLVAAATPQNAAPQVTARAINPTKSGQIGVNPVSDFVTTTTYAPEVTNPSVTMTVGSRPTIMRIPWGIAPQANGDVVFPVTPQGKEFLQGLFDKVNAACALPAKHRKRQPTPGCAPPDALREFQAMGQGGGPLEFDLPFDFSIPLVTAGDVSVALQSTPAAVVVAFLAYLMAVDGKVNDKEAVKVESSDIQSSSTSSSSSESVPTTTYFDNHDSVATDGSDVIISMAQQILAQIKSDWSADADLWGDAPLPAPLPAPSCGPDLENMETTIFKKLGKSFCNDIDLSKEKKKEMTNKDADTTSFDGFKFNLNWEPKDEKCENVNCEDIFNKFASICSYSSHSMRSEGNMDLDCGKASYEIVPKDKPSDDPPDDGNKLNCSSEKWPFRITGHGSHSSINANEGEKAIAEFCKSTKEINPDKEDNTHGYAIGTTGDGSYYGEYWLTSAFTRVILQVGWPEDQNGCDAKKTFKLGEMDDCEEVLKKALNDCDKGQTDVKWGGTVSQNRKDVGCVNFDFSGMFNYDTQSQGSSI